jgi:hypothetical protein
MGCAVELPPFIVVSKNVDSVDSHSESAGDRSEHSAITSRAAKRQRARERRRHGRVERAAAAADEKQQNARIVGSPSRAMPVPLLELPAHAVSRTRVVVKRTFIDVEECEVSNEEQDHRWEIPLTPPLNPGTDNAEFNEWRRAYRRFRLGHHKGAKGEVTPENMRAQTPLEWLDVGGEAVMSAPVAA